VSLNRIESKEEAAFKSAIYSAFSVTLESVAASLEKAIKTIADPCDAVNAFSAWLQVTRDRVDFALDYADKCYQEMR
jgi:hypothetical protein